MRRDDPVETPFAKGAPTFGNIIISWIMTRAREIYLLNTAFRSKISMIVANFGVKAIRRCRTCSKSFSQAVRSLGRAQRLRKELRCRPPPSSVRSSTFFQSRDDLEACAEELALSWPRSGSSPFLMITLASFPSLYSF